jgi:hypothetical protein
MYKLPTMDSRLTKEKDMKRLIFWILLFLFSAHFSKATLSLEDVPNEIILKKIFRHLTHTEVIQSLGSVNLRYHALSQDNFTWKTIVITQPEGTQECKELKAFLDEIQRDPAFRLKNLTISGRKLSLEELIRLGKWLFTPGNPLISLSLTDCGLNSDRYLRGEQSDFIKNLTLWLKENKKLDELNLSGNPLGYSAVEIAKALGENNQLKKIILDRISPSDGIFSAIFSQNLLKNTSLTFVSFCNNQQHVFFQEHLLYDLEISGFVGDMDFKGTLPTQKRVRIQRQIEHNKSLKTRKSL